MGDTTPLRPGVTISRGFSDNPPQYTMGGAIWFYDSSYNSGEGIWRNLEYSNFDGDSKNKWGFWDTIKTGQFAGLYTFNTNVSQHPSGDISNKISGINFGDNGNIGAPQTLVLTKNDLDDPGFLPIDIPLSKRGYDYLLDKAGDIKDTVIDTVGDINDFLDKVGDAINDFDGTPIESDKEPNLADKMKNSLDGIKDGLDLFNKAKEIVKNAPTDENGNIKAGEVGSFENPYQNSVSDTTAQTILDFDIDLAIQAGTLGTRIQSNVSASPGAFGGKGSLGAKGTHNN